MGTEEPTTSPNHAKRPQLPPLHRPTTRTRRFLGRGLAVLLPTLLTLIILLWAYSVLDAYVAGPINKGLQYAQAKWSDPQKLEPYRQYLPVLERRDAKTIDLVRAYWEQHYLGWMGMVAALVLVFGVGLLVSSFLGRAAWRIIERALQRIPGIKQVYPYVKQVTDFLLNEQKLDFSRVVMAEYPRKGCWSMGFVTGLGVAALREATGQDMVAVFIPCSPTPFTGYVVQLAREELVDVPVSVDQALRFLISGGVIRPTEDHPDPQLAAKQRFEGFVDDAE